MSTNILPLQKYTLNSQWSTLTYAKPFAKCSQSSKVVTCSLQTRATQYLLDDIVKHVTPDRKFLDLQPQLQSIASKLLLNSKNFTELFTLEAFLPFLDLFRGNTQIEVNKALLTAFSKFVLSLLTGVTAN